MRHLRRLKYVPLAIAAAAAAALFLFQLLAAGGPEDEQQRIVRTLLTAHVAGDARYTGDVHCTDAAKEGFFREVRTLIFVCAAKTPDGGCDWFRAELRSPTDAGFELSRRDAGCVLPL